MDAFIVNVDHENMTVNMRAGALVPGSVRSPRELSKFLNDSNVFKGVYKEVIDTAFKELSELTEEKEYLIAKGKDAVQGKDGELIFHVNVSGKTEYIGAKEKSRNKRIDFKNAVVIESVKKGDHLLTIVKPTSGEDGYNLSGKILSAKNGKDAVVRLGDSTYCEEGGTEVYAACDGRPIFSHKVLSISPVYEIHGDVCYETGNVFFDGHVFVAGGLQDEFVIEAQSIDIRGVVGAGTIKCKESLVIQGGVNGHGKADITCGADAEIKYINAANIEIKGDLRVKHEIANSDVKSNGRVVAEKIMGGNTLALKGIEARFVGSEIGTPTVLEPGINYEVQKIEGAMRVLSAQIKQLLKPFNRYVGDHEYFQKADLAKQQQIIGCYTYFKRIKAAYLKLLNGRDRFLSEEKFKPVHEVIVLKRLYQDVTVKTSLCSKQFLTEVIGPSKLEEDIDSGSIVSVIHDK